MSEQKKVLILGGGFGGVRAALDLAKLSTEMEVTLVNNTAYHTYIPALYEVANAVMSKEDRASFKALQSTVNIPLKTIFGKRKVKVIEDQVIGIDLDKKQVSLEKGQPLEYDYLVNALGSTTNYFGIKGAVEYSHPLKNLEDALNVRDDIQELIWRHTESLANQPFSIVVAGGGFTGVEFAGSLVHVLKGRGKITILEGMKTVLSGMPAWAQSKALKKLTKMGVTVRLNWLIGEVKEDQIVSTTGESLNYDYLVWTTGVKGQNMPTVTGLTPTKRNQWQVGQFLNLEDHPEVFVIGDVAEYFNPISKSYAPPAAWAALSQAETAARNLVKVSKNQPLLEYHLPKSEFVVPIGRVYGLTNWLDLEWRGWIPAIIKQVVIMKYLWTILPVFKAIPVWLKGLTIYLK